MHAARFIAQSLRYFARSHIGTLLGVIVGSAVLVGALAVGDSVRESLRTMALLRLGKTAVSLASGDRFFRADLAQDLEQDLGPTAPLLQIPGTASNESGTARANRVQVLGVDSNFWKFAEMPVDLGNIDSGAVVLNERLASQLSVRKGDEVVLRVHKPSVLSRESPISPQEDYSLAMRLQVAAILPAEQLGNFSLLANQVPPFNAFVSLATLAEKVNLNGKANMLVSVAPPEINNLQSTLRKHWKLADADLAVRTLTNDHQVELRSGRVFIDRPISAAVLEGSSNAVGVLTYFVNEFRVGEKSTPYSMVTAAEAPIVPLDMQDDEILINEWLAEDLQAKSGDQLAVRYFVVADNQQLEERTNVFRIRQVVPLKGLYADRELMPEFPGIAKAEKTENWDAGFSIDMSRIRPKDEEYWKDHRGTPKAFVTLATGQKLWANRFGDLTAIRFSTTNSAAVEAQVTTRLGPDLIGLQFQPIREQALAASSEAQDFGQLFLGFSFFLVAAALILIGLLYAFALEQRAGEVGTLLAVGLRPQQVRRMLLWEALGLSMAGGVVGVLTGILYAKGMLHGLATIWRAAVGTSALAFHVTPLTLVIGVAASVLISTGAIWIVLRKQARAPARELLSETNNLEPNLALPTRRVAEWVFVVAAAVAFALLGFAFVKKETGAAGIFFGAGMLLLIAGLAGVATLFKRMATANRSANVSETAIGFRSVIRRRKRSLATVALLATGCFLVVAVSAFRLETDQETNRKSGTGGFQWIGETALPVVKDLNSESGRDFFGLNARDLSGVSFVPFRVREGDDASCLNLNRPQKPRILGVAPGQLQQRNAFSFAKVVKGLPEHEPWLLLKASAPDEVPAIADAASIQWSLKKKVGDTIDFVDEHGKPFRIRIVAALANSILQGSLLIDEAQFIQRFPGETGYRMFLVDAPSNEADKVAPKLTRGLRDAGLELTPATERLAAYNAVQNTYLSTFQLLGGLGLLLGTAGLGIVVLRNVLERRAELALLQAVGFRKRTLAWLVLSEHAGLLVMGLMVGVVAAIAAVAPELLAGQQAAPVRLLSVLFAGILVSGLIWTALATRIALRGELLKALRNE